MAMTESAVQAAGQVAASTLRETIENGTVVPLYVPPPAPSFCAALGISQSQAYRLVRAERVPVLRAGKRLMVPCSFVRSVLAGDVVLTLEAE